MFAGKEMLERQIYQMIWAFCAAANFLEDYPLNNKKEFCIKTLKLVWDQAAFKYCWLYSMLDVFHPLLNWYVLMARKSFDTQSAGKADSEGIPWTVYIGPSFCHQLFIHVSYSYLLTAHSLRQCLFVSGSRVTLYFFPFRTVLWLEILRLSKVCFNVSQKILCSIFQFHAVYVFPFLIKC